MNNEKAFPIYGVTSIAQEGMDLRDWFAGMALQGLITHHGKDVYVVEIAYEIADAMMKERKA